MFDLSTCAITHSKQYLVIIKEHKRPCDIMPMWESSIFGLSSLKINHNASPKESKISHNSVTDALNYIFPEKDPLPLGLYLYSHSRRMKENKVFDTLTQKVQTFPEYAPCLLQVPGILLREDRLG